MTKRIPTYVGQHPHKRRSPCCEDEAQRYLLAQRGTFQPDPTTWYRHGDAHDDPGGYCKRCEQLDEKTDG
jgi:hypothetical protein